MKISWKKVMENKTKEEIMLEQLKDILEQAHKDYIELEHASAFEQELHFDKLKEIYDYISDYFEGSYSTEYVQKLEEENEDLKAAIKQLKKGEK